MSFGIMGVFAGDLVWSTIKAFVTNHGISGVHKLLEPTTEQFLYKGFVEVIKAFIKEKEGEKAYNDTQLLETLHSTFASKKINPEIFTKVLQPEGSFVLEQFIRDMCQQEEALNSAPKNEQPESLLYNSIINSIIINYNLEEKCTLKKTSMERLLFPILRRYTVWFLTPLKQQDKYKIMDYLLDGKVQLTTIASQLAQLADKINNINTHFKTQFVAILSPSFWEAQRNLSFNQERALSSYYLQTKSTTTFLFQIVTHQLHEKNITMQLEFDKYLREHIEYKREFSLIKILAAGGVGKSTFLLDLAYYYQQLYHIVYLDGSKVNNLKEVGAALNKTISYIVSDHPILIMVDNAAALDKLYELPEQLESDFHGFNFVMVIAEREFRYNELSIKEEFEVKFAKKVDTRII